ncbi:MAG: GGDEF domain-containing protein [Capsulimonadales bacterium]|nr:GGDEF domain-containing protein [Capsulimonadales bacterium]
MNNPSQGKKLSVPRWKKSHRLRQSRRTAHWLYRLRGVGTVTVMRNAIFAALVLLAIATFTSMLVTNHQFDLQEQLHRQNQEWMRSRPSVRPMEGILTLERRMEQDSRVIQTSFYVQSILTLGLLLLCFLYFVGDRADRLRQERRLRIANRRLSRLAEVDGLTELKNRRAFEGKLQEEWERSRRYGSPLSLLLVDVDHFKKYNDSFGHLAGDLALKMTAEILRRACRRNDFPARYGGEEFAVLLPHTSSGAALVAAERIRAAFLATSWPERPITVSIGVATSDPSFEIPSQFVNEADRALYFAKYRGRNQVVHARDTTLLPS